MSMPAQILRVREARSELESLAPLMREMRLHLKTLRALDKSTPEIEEKVSDIEREVRNARARLRRMERRALP